MLDTIQKKIRYTLEFIRQKLSRVTSLTLKLASDLFSAVKSLKLISRLPKRPVKFIKRYSLQIGFGVILAIFLTVSVGENTYPVGAADFSSDIDVAEAGFIGKPQLFVGETVLTGEVQQAAAISYTVEKGDSISSIASRYRLGVGSILDTNNLSALDSTKIKPGDELLIPANDTNTSLAWLEKINAEKARQQKLAEAARQKQLANNNQLGTAGRVAVSTGAYSILGTFRYAYNGRGYPGQCTSWVLRQRLDLPAQMGNANQYLSSARAYGIPTSRTPNVGDVGVRNSESRVGHVVYVTAVNGSKVTFTEMNYVAPNVVDVRTEDVSTFSGFVHHR